MKNKYLVNVSNHHSSTWSENQKKDWTVIYDIPFPNIDPNASIEDLKEMATTCFYRILDLLKVSREQRFVMLQGEYSFCYILKEKLDDFCTFAIPTSERKVVLNTDVDGKTTKTIVFEFVQWRYLI